MKRFYCTRIEDRGGMRGPVVFHAVKATAPEEKGVAVREVGPATELFDWEERPLGRLIPSEYTPSA